MRHYQPVDGVVEKARANTQPEGVSESHHTPRVALA